MCVLGINDAPALAQADVGISISETASDISASAADIVLLNGQGLANLPFLFLLSDSVRNIVVQVSPVILSGSIPAETSIHDVESLHHVLGNAHCLSACSEGMDATVADCSAP